MVSFIPSTTTFFREKVLSPRHTGVVDMMLECSHSRFLTAFTIKCRFR